MRVSRARAIIGILLAAQSGNAQAPGTFAPTGSMTTSRIQHTATLLATGKVLITGGYQSVYTPAYVEVPVASAELYDPSTGTFSGTGNMTTPRAGHTATLLANGKVLITGGSDFASAELYDPSMGAFIATGEMTSPRSFHTATLLSNGRVLIAGGGHYPVGALATAEIYDPASGTFSVTGTMATAQYLPTSTLLANSKVLIQGGTYGIPGVSNGGTDAELFDPGTGTFSRTAPEAHPNSWAATATLLTNGKVFDTLTDDSGDPIDDIDLYDPSTGTFATEKMTSWRRGQAATLLPDATVLIAGGGDTSIAPAWSVSHTSGAELYDPATNTFSATGSMAVNREGHSATVLPDGTVLVTGGWTYLIGSTDTAEIYHPRVLIPSPVLFSLSGDGHGQGAIWHTANGEAASPGSPAVAGEVLSMYTINLIEGAVIPPQVAIGGQLAEILYFGDAPGYPGYSQVNFKMPEGVASGPNVSVWLTYLQRPSNEVTIAVQ
jgi:hypothetical protein